ncbi:MAG: ATP-binding protein [Clostridia bacterium]|nr:ATP-binding protein [Clostridia bacterium]
MMKLLEIYRKICAFAVFGGLHKKPLFEALAAFCEAEDGSFAKHRAYGALVHEIYCGGGSLSECVRHAVFSDENVYVKAMGNMQAVNPNVARAAHAELATLSALASLTPANFGMGDDAPQFESHEIDLVAEYDKRVADIGKYGYGIFTSSAMFSVGEEGEILPIASADRISLDRFVGYREERERVIENTLAFLDGRSATNALLYGDAGTGKSSTVKAIVNAYFDRGLRLIELRKNQLLLLPRVMDEISENPLKFIIFVDDLSFNQNDDSFSMLKATLEGSACARAANAVIYATSNRRHMVKETFSEREGGDIHRNDTVQETLSLSERFGLRVLFAKPEKSLYLEIVNELAARRGVKKDKAELEREAEAFALARGYRSARSAEQFIESLM